MTGEGADPEAVKGAAGGPVTMRLRGRMDTLQPKFRQIAEIVLADPPAASGMSIGALAREAGCSEATVVRLASELGYGGYREFRRNLYEEIAVSRERASGRAFAGDIHPEDDLVTVVGKIAHADSRAVWDTAQALDIEVLAEVADAISRSSRIAVFGAGASGIAGLDLQQKFARIGLYCSAYRDVHDGVPAAALLGPRGVAIGLSHTGQTDDVIDAIGIAAETGATTVAVTSAPTSLLARRTDHLLLTAAIESAFRSGATASRIAQLTVIDCLLIAVARCLPDLGRQALETTRSAMQSWRRS